MFLFLDPSTDVKLIVEVTALVMSVVFLILTGRIFANIDVVALRLRTLVFFVDLTSTVLVVAILLVYGQGFSPFGVSYLIGSLGLTYLAEGMEVEGRLNSRQNKAVARNVKYLMYLQGYLLRLCSVSTCS